MALTPDFTHELGINDDIDDFDDLSDKTLLHDRTYRVRSYFEDEGHMRIRGMVRDRKPAGLYVRGDDVPLMVHHMVVDLVVSYPALAIEAANVVIETHPHDTCPRIEDHYGKLVGLSIARGFTHKVRELFGGPRGCTHTTALLQAMAPVAIQSTWSMRAAVSDGDSEPVAPPRMMTPEQRREAMRFNIDTCHVWASDGEMIARIDRGEQIEPPKWAADRMRARGLDPESWQE